MIHLEFLHESQRKALEDAPGTCVQKQLAAVMFAKTMGNSAALRCLAKMLDDMSPGEFLSPAVEMFSRLMAAVEYNESLRHLSKQRHAAGAELLAGDIEAMFELFYISLGRILFDAEGADEDGLSEESLNTLEAMTDYVNDALGEYLRDHADEFVELEEGVFALKDAATAAEDVVPSVFAAPSSTTLQ